MIAVLTMPKFFNTILVGGALLGFVIALPVAWVASKKLSSPCWQAIGFPGGTTVRRDPLKVR